MTYADANKEYIKRKGREQKLVDEAFADGYNKAVRDIQMGIVKKEMEE